MRSLNALWTGAMPPFPYRPTGQPPKRLSAPLCKVSRALLSVTGDRRGWGPGKGGTHALAGDVFKFPKGAFLIIRDGHSEIVRLFHIRALSAQEWTRYVSK